MELRHHSHVHFIQAIKGGLVVKVLNVDSLGRPALRVKQIEAINGSQDAGNLSSCSKLKQHKDGFTGSPVGHGWVKTEMPFRPMGGMIVKRELKTDELSEDDDDSCSMITLKELRDRCKMKKRKLGRSNFLMKQDMGICSPAGSFTIKRENDAVQSKEAVCDLDEPLSSLKLKLSKKSKAKLKCIEKSMSSNAVVSLGALTEQISTCPQNSLKNNRDIHEPVKIKIENLEPGSSDCQNVACVADGSTSDSHAKMIFCGEGSDEMPKGVNNGGELEIRESTFSTEEIPSYSVTEVSLGCSDLEEAHVPVSNTEVPGEVTKLGSLGMINHESFPRFVSECLKELNVIHPIPHSCPEESFPVPNDVDYEICVSHKSLSSHQEQISCQMDGNSVTQMLDMAVSDILCCRELNYDGDGCGVDIDGEGDSKEGALPDLREKFMDNNTVTQMPDMAINDSLQSIGLNYSGDGCISATDGEVDSKKDTPPNPKPNAMSDSNSLCIPSLTSYPCFNPHNGPDFMDDGSPTAWEKHSSLTSKESVFSGIAEAVKCSSGNYSSATAGLKSLEGPQDHHGLKLKHPPKRLFPTRKAISPTSQEKLRQAWDAEELHDDIELSKCREGLCFEKQTKNNDSSLRSDLEGSDISISPEQIIKKRRNANMGSPQLVPKGILKVPRVSCATQRAGTECTSAHTCAQKAIAFSQRQMQDIESLATKLMEELKSMKEIVEETLCSEASPSTSLKYTSEEMRITIQNVEGTEETTRKWLSMMAKDCNRFCKIMRSTERKAAEASGNRVHKENKKIIFADEAGGMLCHVKVFEEPQVSLMVSESQNGLQ